MKALTISQPFASLIASGEKWVENRTWETDYRGPLAIHAGKRSRYLEAEDLRRYPTGCIVAVCRLALCVRLGLLRQRLESTNEVFAWLVGHTIEEVLAHRHTEGPWCWILKDVRPLPSPLHCRGAQGLWNWDEDGREVKS